MIVIDSPAGIDAAERVIFAHEILDTLGLAKPDDRVEALAAQLGIYRKHARRTWASRRRWVEVRLAVAEGRA